METRVGGGRETGQPRKRDTCGSNSGLQSWRAGEPVRGDQGPGGETLIPGWDQCSQGEICTLLGRGTETDSVANCGVGHHGSRGRETQEAGGGRH